MRSSRPELDDGRVLDAIDRFDVVTRSLLQHALSGRDPANILARLKGRIESIQGALPSKISYYTPVPLVPFGPQALRERLMTSWFALATRNYHRSRLKRSELQALFGPQAPKGAHVLEARPGSKPRVLQVYAPQTADVARGIVRHFDKAASLPRVQRAITARRFGFAILLPWLSDQERPLGQALHGKPPTRALEPIATLAAEAFFRVECVATPETLQLATAALRAQT